MLLGYLGLNNPLVGEIADTISSSTWCLDILASFKLFLSSRRSALARDRRPIELALLGSLEDVEPRCFPDLVSLCSWRLRPLALGSGDFPDRLRSRDSGRDFFPPPDDEPPPDLLRRSSLCFINAKFSF